MVGSSSVQVAALREEVLAQISPKSRSTYRPGIELLVREYGSWNLEDLRLPHLERLRDRTRRRVGEATVSRALTHGRRLRSYDPDAYGRGAAENLVRAVRFYFRYACACGHLSVDPSLGLRAPKRPRSPERPLTSEELADVWVAALTGSNDPELDELILAFARHTAARREGCLNLCVDHLDACAATVTLSEKNGAVRTLPLRVELIHRLLQHARARGAQEPGDAVLRQRNGRPLTRRRFNTLFDRVDAHTTWTEALDVGIHWIRHTTLSDIAATAGLRVAGEYAGHHENQFGTIGVYTRPTFQDLVDAYEAVFGARF